MSATLMQGKEIAARLVENAAKRAQVLAGRGCVPCLATVLVGDDPGSVTYVKMKQRRCESAGLRSVHIQLSATATTAELLAAIDGLAGDPAVHGILLQHPVPRGIDERAAFERIPAAKDVDGVTAVNAGRLSLGLPGFAPCTPAGILRLLDAHGVSPRGKRAVVVGRSPILGRPAAALLLAADATVTVCHSRTVDLPAVVREAEILVAAVGKPRFVRGDWIREGAVVVDAGYSEGNIGDVDFEGALPRASLITPVPGGVGPMTIAVLVEQTVDAAERACR